MVRMVGRAGHTGAAPDSVGHMEMTDARLVARLHVDYGHVSSAVCMPA
jgi:hypothetical protein